MNDTPAISDRNLEATTHISLKREPACFAFLSAAIDFTAVADRFDQPRSGLCGLLSGPRFGVDHAGDSLVGQQRPAGGPARVRRGVPAAVRPRAGRGRDDAVVLSHDDPARGARGRPLPGRRIRDRPGQAVEGTDPPAVRQCRDGQCRRVARRRRDAVPAAAHRQLPARLLEDGVSSPITRCTICSKRWAASQNGPARPSRPNRPRCFRPGGSGRRRRRSCRPSAWRRDSPGRSRSRRPAGYRPARPSRPLRRRHRRRRCGRS